MRHWIISTKIERDRTDRLDAATMRVYQRFQRSVASRFVPFNPAILRPRCVPDEKGPDRQVFATSQTASGGAECTRLLTGTAECAGARRRLAKPASEQPVEVRYIAEPGSERDIDDASVREARIGEHRIGAFEPALREMFGERFASLFEYSLNAAPRQAESPRNAVDIERRIAAAPRDFGQDGAQPRRLQPTPGDDLRRVGCRPNR